MQAISLSVVAFVLRFNCNPYLNSIKICLLVRGGPNRRESYSWKIYFSSQGLLPLAALFFVRSFCKTGVLASHKLVNSAKFLLIFLHMIVCSPGCLLANSTKPLFWRMRWRFTCRHATDLIVGTHLWKSIVLNNVWRFVCAFHWSHSAVDRNHGFCNFNNSNIFDVFASFYTFPVPVSTVCFLETLKKRWSRHILNYLEIRQFLSLVPWFRRCAFGTNILFLWRSTFVRVAFDFPESHFPRDLCLLNNVDGAWLRMYGFVLLRPPKTRRVPLNTSSLMRRSPLRCQWFS